MRRKPLQLLRGPVVRALGIVALANLVFLGLVLVAQGDPCVTLSRVRVAFNSDELRTRDFLWNDARRGWFQFDDCNALQMLTNQGSSRLERALSPTVFQENEDWEGQCRVLRFLAEGWVDANKLLPVRYTRYWHGYNVVAALGLRYMELENLRRALSGAVWLAIGTLAFASLRSGPRARRAGLIIALVAATVWSVPYFAPGLTQGPGDALLLLGLAAIAAWPRMTIGLGTIVPYAAGFGAAVVFLEMLTGKLPTAIAWLAAMTLAAARDEGRRGRAAAPKVALAAVTAFCLAAVATVIAKLVLTAVLVDPHAGADFLARLRVYTGAPDYGSYSPRWLSKSQANLPGILLPFARLFRQTGMLTYGSGRAGYALTAATGLAWFAAAILGWRARHGDRGQDMLILIAAALMPVVWVFLLPRHAYIHAPFMVRMLVVPISLAPLALCWPRAQEGDVRLNASSSAMRAP